MLDVALQCFGSADAVIKLCIGNGFALGQYIAPGTIITIDENNIIDKSLTAYYGRKKITVASAGNIPTIENNWILYNGFWDDDKVWVDGEVWNDG